MMKTVKMWLNLALALFLLFPWMNIRET